MNHSAPQPITSWSDETQASIASRLEQSEAQIHAGKTATLEPLLDELHALADQLEAGQQPGSSTAPR